MRRGWPWPEHVHAVGGDRHELLPPVAVHVTHRPGKSGIAVYLFRDKLPARVIEHQGVIVQAQAQCFPAAAAQVAGVKAVAVPASS